MQFCSKIFYYTVTLAVLCVGGPADLIAALPKAIKPFEASLVFRKVNPIDDYILQGLRSRGLQPAPLCSDSIFIRRLFIALLGRLPTAREVVDFLQESRFDKRSCLLNRLMQRPEFADYQTLKWGDILRIKAEFPINLWPNGVQAYNRWIHTALQKNMPYNQMAMAMLTGSGSNFREPQVNFFRALQSKTPEGIAKTVALTFMGVRFKSFTSAQQKALIDCFSRVRYKKSAEWKEEIVYNDPTPYPQRTITMPDGKLIHLTAYADPRHQFAAWLTAPDNPWFAKNIVNRIWFWLMGSGIIEPADDIRATNPAKYPRVLAYLEQELIKSNYDLHHIYRLIINSRTYQQSALARGKNALAEKWFACYPVRRLDAEVLADAVCNITGTHESYSSMIPEPFTFIPEEAPTITLGDGSITSQFLVMFGRPARDTGLLAERNNSPNSEQSLHLLNSTHIQNKLAKSWRLRALLRRYRRRPRELIKKLYLTILARYPTPHETKLAGQYYKKMDNSRQATIDLVWALLNSKEFVYQH